MIRATFIGGPEDGNTRWVDESCGPCYRVPETPPLRFLRPHEPVPFEVGCVVHTYHMRQVSRLAWAAVHESLL